MKKVTAFVGCATKKATYHAVRQFLDNLQAHGDVEVEIVRLSDYRLEPCRGCKQCFTRGEEHCPLKDDRDLLLAKLKAADGVVFATPNYSFQVSALLKLLLDRLGYAFHRPQFHGKTFTSIVIQGFYGARTIERYLDFVGTGLGFNPVRGSCLTALEPMGEKERRTIERKLAQQAERFHAGLVRPAYPSPSLLMLIGFRNGRTCVRLECDEDDRDYQVYRAKGWLESDYWYPVELGLVKRGLGRFVDWLASRRYGAKRVSTTPALQARSSES
jgi:NAD(P)H-dependent FMN reductase